MPFFKRLINIFFQKINTGKLLEAERLTTNAVKAVFTHGARLSYNRNESSELTKLVDKYGSDKGTLKETGHAYPWPAHSYTDFYDLLFKGQRKQINLLIECGIGTNKNGAKSSMTDRCTPGASLRAWMDYFPNADIIGLDIDKDILFTHGRIRCYYIDQTKAETIQAMVQEHMEKNSADIIIDDGLHEYHAGVTFFENMINVLKNDGTYIIEDVVLEDLEKYAAYFSQAENQEKYHTTMIHFDRPDERLRDNSIIVIRHKDKNKDI